MGQTKILVVDDSELALKTSKAILEKQGYAVVTADSPFDLDRIIRKERPSLLLMDVDMPMLNGGKLVEAVQRHQLDACPVVFFSGLPREELEALVVKHGVAGFIEKRRLKDLGAEVERFLVGER